MILRDYIQYVAWVIVATIWASLCFVLPYFVDNPIEGFKGFLAVVAYFTACAVGVFFLLYVIGCNRYVCAVFLPIFSIGGAIVSFYRLAYHVTITPMIIEVCLNTNIEEVSGVVSWSLIVWLIINLGVAILLCLFRIEHIFLKYAWVHVLASCLLGVGYFTCNSRLQNGLCQRYPYIIPYNIAQYISLRQMVSQNRVVPAYMIEESPDSLTIVLVLGEAVRADHVQLNGYERETSPSLMNRNNVVSFPNIYCEQTHTLASLPYLLTRADSIHEERQYTETSFVSIFRKEGFHTSWISNQDNGFTFAPFISECDTTIYVNAGKTVYVFSPWLDEEILPVFDAVAEQSSTHELYIIHPIGSHWYYNNHVPEDRCYFQPITTNRLPTANTIEQLTNSYDNTVRYMDFVLDEIIRRLEDKNAIVIYQADHGEALGEQGEFLHANDAEIVKHPACIIWYSERFAEAYPDKVKSLIANKDKHYRTDYMFYTILSAAGIQAEGYTQDLDIFH